MLSEDVGLYGEQIAVLFGFITFGLFVAMALTCRYFPPLATKAGLRLLVENRAYRSAFKWHTLIWYAFAWFMLVHIGMGLLHTEWPDPADSDYLQHLWILIFAIMVFISVVLVFSNCRSFASILRLAQKRDPLTSGYSKFYRFHSVFWIILLVALAGHLVASYTHIGFWPTHLE